MTNLIHLQNPLHVDLRIWTSSVLLHSMRFNKHPVCDLT